VPLAAFSEACIGLGLFVSALILVVVCSFLYTEQIAGLHLLLPLAFLGAFSGDHFGYYVGRWIGPSLPGSRFGQRYATRIGQAEALIRRWGWGAIMIGRFLPAIRSIIPAMTGVSGFGRLRYTIFDTAACLLWMTGLALILVGVENVRAW